MLLEILHTYYHGNQNILLVDTVQAVDFDLEVENRLGVDCILRLRILCRPNMLVERIREYHLLLDYELGKEMFLEQVNMLELWLRLR